MAEITSPEYNTPINLFYIARSASPRAKGGSSYTIYFMNSVIGREYQLHDRISGDPRQIGSLLDAYKTVMAMRNRTSSTTCMLTFVESATDDNHTFYEVDLDDEERWFELILTYG